MEQQGQKLLPNQTLIILKPDALQRGLQDELLSFFLRKGIRIAKSKKVTVKKKIILRHYEEVIERIGKGPFRDYVVNEFVNQEVFIAILEQDSEGLVLRVRALIGATDPALAAPDSLRGMYGKDSLAQAREEQRMLRNLIHASDSFDSFVREVSLWFS